MTQLVKSIIPGTSSFLGEISYNKDYDFRINQERKFPFQKYKLLHLCQKLGITIGPTNVTLMVNILDLKYYDLAPLRHVGMVFHLRM